MKEKVALLMEKTLCILTSSQELRLSQPMYSTLKAGEAQVSIAEAGLGLETDLGLEQVPREEVVTLEHLGDHHSIKT